MSWDQQEDKEKNKPTLKQNKEMGPEFDTDSINRDVD